VLICGDGDDPDSGELLAQEIAASGIKNVFFVSGGAKALRARPMNRHTDARGTWCDSCKSDVARRSATFVSVRR